MAKEDFCFTYYDGDAARDTTHMNRLERGAYHDLVISQRKFGHLSLDQVKKILGKDFTECWAAIELIMKVDADGRFFIEWLETSVIKARKHSKKQSENRKGKTKENQTTTKQQPNNNQTKPLGDEDGNGDEVVIEFKENESEKIVLETTEVFAAEVDPLEQDLQDAFDERYLSDLKIKWPHVDFDFEFRFFCDKVRGSPDHYQDHRSSGLRLALLSQLRGAKHKSDATTKTKQKRNTSDLISGFNARYGSDAN